MSWFTFFGFLGTTEYCRLVRLKLCVNLKETERERERESVREGGRGGDGRGRRKRAGKRRERGSHREGKVVGRKGRLCCDQDIECS